MCVFVCLFVCQYYNSRTVTDIITKFPGHHPEVERADKFENGNDYITGVRGWRLNASDVVDAGVLANMHDGERRPKNSKQAYL